MDANLPMDLDVKFCRFKVNEFLRYWLPGWLVNLIGRWLPDQLLKRLFLGG